LLLPTRDSEDFVRELRAEIAQAGLDDEIKFLGALSVARLRDAYASSAVMALPTYHHEGCHEASSRPRQ